MPVTRGVRGAGGQDHSRGLPGAERLLALRPVLPLLQERVDAQEHHPLLHSGAQVSRALRHRPQDLSHRHQERA